MATYSKSHSSDEPSQRDLDLADLSSSDEDVEALLSGGADVDDLISAGVLDDGSDEREGWQDVEGVELLEQPVLTPMTPEAFQALMTRCDWLIKQGRPNAPSQPL